jgi:hypothetical protein
MIVDSVIVPVTTSTNINDNKLKREEIHRKIDNTVSSIVKNMENTFESINFNDNQILEESNNLELFVSNEAISNNLEELLKIVYDMKVDFLKKNEFKASLKKDLQKEIGGMMQANNTKIYILQENYNFINSLLREMKNNKYYKYSLNFNLD